MGYVCKEVAKEIKKLLKKNRTIKKVYKGCVEEFDVETGSVNKLKVIKRIMYGRNSFELLKSKILLYEMMHH